MIKLCGQAKLLEWAQWMDSSFPADPTLLAGSHNGFHAMFDFLVCLASKLAGYVRARPNVL